MTVNTEVSEETFIGNGVTTQFPLTFRFFDDSNLKVTRLEDSSGNTELLVLGADYSVSGANNASGGAVTLLQGPLSIGYRLNVERVLNAVQDTSFINQGKFFPEVHEKAFDYLTMLIQQAFTSVKRALVRPSGRNYYDAEGRQIKNMADPVADQDAATGGWVSRLIGSVLETGQGPANIAENVIYVDGDMNPTTVQKGITRQFGSVLSMLGRDGYRSGEQAALLSYHAGLGIGGGAIYWDASRPKIQHNGGTVIDPDRIYPSDWDNLESLQSWFSGVPGGSGVGCWVRKESGGVNLVTWFGAKGDGITNDHPAYNACAIASGAGATLIFTPTPQSYRMHQFFGYDNQRVIAYGARIDLFKLSPTTGPTVLAASGNNARYEGVWLNCLETNLPNVRTSFEDRGDAHWYKCRFEGFRDAAAPNLNNAWGTYFKRATNITLELCQFENNSQNDIAVLEGSKNIRIISPYGSALNINLEPNNDTSAVRNITLSNASVRKLLMQENALTGNSCNNVLIEACDIQELAYDGCGVEFRSSRIQTIAPAPDGLGRCYGGNLRLGGALGVGANMLRDPNLVSVSATDPNSSWQVYVGSISPAARYASVTTAHGRALRVNPTSVSGTASLRSENLAVVAGNKYLLSALSGANYPTGAGQIGVHFGVRWLNSSLAEISTTICPINRAPIPTSIATSAPVSLESAVLIAPAGSAFAQVLVGNTLGSATTASTDWYSVGLHPIVEAGSGSGMPDPYQMHQAILGNLLGKGGAAPSASPVQYYYRDYLVGDKIVNYAPVAGGYEGWVCTASGSPGVWKGYGLIQS